MKREIASERDVEAGLRDWATRARNAPTAITTGPPAGTPRRGGRAALAVVAVVTVVLTVAVAAALVALQTTRDRAAVGGSLPQLSGQAAASAGTTRLTFHGISIEVPTWWRVVPDSTACSSPDGVVSFSPAAGCPAGPVRDPYTFTNRVVFDDDIAAPSSTAQAGVEHRQIGTYAATLRTITHNPWTTITITIPQLKASVLIERSTPTQAQEMAQSLHIVGYDANGCASTQPGLGDLRAFRPAAIRRAASPAVSPDTSPAPSRSAASVVLCRYLGGYIEQSTRLDPADSQRFTAALAHAPTGLSYATSPPLASTCRTSAASDGTPSGDTAYDSEAFLAMVTTANSQTHPVLIRLGSCGALGTSDGLRTTQRTNRMATLITTAVGTSQGYPSTVTPRK